PLHSTTEDQRDALVALQVHATDRSSAVVHIETARQLGVLRLELHVLRIGEVLLYVRLRSEQALLLTGPQADAHGPAELHAALLQDPHRFEHDRRPRCIVRRAGAALPGIAMHAEHDELS